MKLSGEAPIALVSSVRPAPAPEPEPAAAAAPEAGDAPKGVFGRPPVDYRGLGRAGVVEALQALRPHFASAGALGRALGEQPTIIGAMLTDKRAPSARVVEALYGPTGAELLPRWLDLLAGRTPPPADEEPEPDLQPPSTLHRPPAADAPVAETAPAEGCLLYTSPSPAAEPGAARPGDQGAGEDQGAPAFDLRNLRELRIEGGVEFDAAAYVTAGRLTGPFPAVQARLAVDEVPGLPSWAGIPDDQLLTILRGKAAGLEAELAALDAEEAELRRRLAALSGRGEAIDTKLVLLRQAIAAFEEEGADG